MKKVKIIATEEVSRDQRVIKEADYLSSKRFEVEILCWDREGEFQGEQNGFINNIKIKRFIQKSAYGTGFKQLIPFLKFVRGLRQYLEDTECDVLHCQNLDGAIAGLLVNNKKVVVFDMREFFVGRTKNKIRKFFIHILVAYTSNKSDYIIYVNETQKNRISRRNLRKTVFLPNYPLYSFWKSIKKRTHPNKTVVSYIGGVRQYEEFVNLFEAVKQIDNVFVEIHGTGVTYNRLKELENKYTNVYLTGRFELSEIKKLYSKSDIIYCIYSIENENWRTAYPIKFFEAIMTKTPMVVNKGTVLEQIVHDYNIGFVVDGNNKEEIRALIKTIVENKDILDEKIFNLEKIQYKFCWESVVDNLDFIYS